MSEPVNHLDRDAVTIEAAADDDVYEVAVTAEAQPTGVVRATLRR